MKHYAFWYLLVFAVGLLVAEPCCCAQTPAPSHGTVNIFVSNGSDMVVVVDSMLSFTDGHSDYHHVPSGTKLFRLDDTTVLAMANFYDQPGPRQLINLEAFFPAIAAEVPKVLAIQAKSTGSSVPFLKKAQDVDSVFSTNLTNHIRSMIANDRNFNIHDRNLMILLTLAGYDLDGRLKVAEITLAPGFSEGHVEYVPVPRPITNDPAACELIGRRGRLHPQHAGILLTVHGPLFCDIVGISETAEYLLNHPSLAVNRPGIKKYENAQHNHQPLSLEDLRQLALELEDETAVDPKVDGFVGGPARVAILAHGKVVEAPEWPFIPQNTGSALSKGTFTQITGGGDVGGACFGGANNVLTAAHFRGCTQPLDGLTFQSSSFDSMTLTYDGKAPFVFSKDNAVVDTRLVLGKDVDLDAREVKELMCGFAWSSITFRGVEVHPDCRR